MQQDSIWQSVVNTWSIEAESISHLHNRIDQEAVVSVVKLLGDCTGKILVAGCGTSAAAAKKIAHSLCCVERPACYLNPSDAVHGALGMLQPNDVLILISKGGNTGEITNLIPACKTKGAKLIGVTENENSILAEHADILFKVKVEKEPCPFNMLATASTLAVIAAFDAVCIALMHYTHYTKEAFAVIHPGGAVGNRLLKKEDNK
ncbi:MAG: hypothetical protein K0S71_2358 [Clostridia bacterium]|nr:hypothetical protein [Clostridia bacterium]